MNVFWHELKIRKKSITLWVIVMIIFMLMCLAKFETTTEGGGAAMQKMMASFPATIQAVFGMNGLDLTTIAGYFGVCLLFVYVILAVQAGLLGGGIVAEESADKTTEFLYVKPRSRTRILFAKLWAGLIVVALVWLATVAGSLIGLHMFVTTAGFMDTFWQMMLAALIVQLCFFGFGLLMSVWPGRSSKYAGLVAIMVFVQYLLYVAGHLMPQATWVGRLSLLSYFDAKKIIDHGIDHPMMIIALCLVFVMIIVSFWLHQKRDMES